MRKEMLMLTYETTPEISGLGGDVGGQADVLVSVDQGVASKVEPAILKIMIYKQRHEYRKHIWKVR